MTLTILKVQNTANGQGKVFEVECLAAGHSTVLHTLVGDFGEDQLQDAIIPIQIDISDDGLACIIQWMHEHKHDTKVHEPFGSTEDQAVDFTAWDQQFFDAMESPMLFEVLVAANYLEIMPLLRQGCQVAAGMICGKSTVEIRGILNIENDFTPEEEEAVRKEKTWLYMTALADDAR